MKVQCMLCDIFEKSQDPNLLLTPFTEFPEAASDINATVYCQGNSQGSRKKVLPLIRAYLDVHGDGKSEQPTVGAGSVKPEMSESDSKPAPSAESDTPVTEGNMNQNNVPSGDVTPSLDFLDLDPFRSGSLGAESSTDTHSTDLLVNTSAPATELTQTSGTPSSVLLDFGDFGESHTDPGVHINIVGESSTDPEPSITSEGLLDLGFTPGSSSDDAGKDLLAELDPFAGHTGVLMEKSPDQLATPELQSATSSVPETPPGSPSNEESAFGRISDDLPSFNSSEMVRKIREKKASMGEGEGDSGERSPQIQGQDEDHEDPDKFPFTPQNSITESDFDKFAEGAGLPSFNSSEMVQKIQNKKASLSGMEDIESDQIPMDKSEDPSRYPFTPQNSLQEQKFDTLIKELNLPSFNSSAMVEKIREKKAELEAMTGNLDEEVEEEAREEKPGDDDPESCPFTPSNSLGETSLDEYAEKHNLPSFHNSEMLDKIEAKRTSLGDYESDDIKEAKKLPFTPPNSFDIGDAFPGEKNSPVKTPVSPDDLWSKLESSEVFLKGPEDSESDELPAETIGNVVAFNIARQMREMSGEGGSAPDELHTASTGNVIAYGIAQDMRRAAAGEAGDSEPFLSQTADILNAGAGDVSETVHTENTGNVVAHRIAQTMKGLDAREPATPAESLNQESAAEIEIARGVAHDIIQDALDNFDLIPVDGEGGESKSLSLPLAANQEEGEADSCESDVTASGSFTSGSECEPTSPDLVETNYMPGLDPLRESSGIADKDLSTNVHKVIAEEESFEQNRRESYTEGDEEEQPDMNQIKVVGFAPISAANTNSDSNKNDVNFSNNNNDVEQARTDAAEQVVSKAITEAVEIVRQERDYSLPPPVSDSNHLSLSNGNAAGSSMLSVPMGGRPRCVSPAPGTTADSSRLEAIMDLGQPPEPLQETDDDPLGVKRPPNEDEDDDEELKTLADQIPEELRAAMEADYSVGNGSPAMRPNNLDAVQKKKIIPNLDLLNDDDMNDIEVALSGDSSSEGDTEDIVGLSIEGEKTPDDLNTPDALNNSMFEEGELEWSGSTPHTPVDPIPEYSARDEYEENRNWRTVKIGDRQYKIDMKVIEPYKKVLSHGGYYGDGFNAIVVFAACYLPDKRRRDYHYVMDNLFLYVVSTLELLVVEDYMIVYFHGATPRYKMPSLRWLKRCYEMIDRRLRKNLKGLLIVHPTLWLRTIVLMTRPFISSKFYSKLKYVRSLEELTHLVPTEYIYIPDEIKVADQTYQKKHSVPKKKFVNH